MSNPNITIGSSFDGIIKGKVKFSGTNKAETVSTHSYNIGGKAAGEVDATGEIIFNEVNTTT